MYLLCSTNPTNLDKLWRDYDNINREAIIKILGVPLNQQHPVDPGPAPCRSWWIGSEGNCGPRLGRLHQLPTLLPRSKGEDAEPASGGLPRHPLCRHAEQVKIDLYKHQLLSEHISTTGVQREIARLSNLQLPHSGDWINVIPSPSIGLQLRSTTTQALNVAYTRKMTQSVEACSQ